MNTNNTKVKTMRGTMQPDTMKTTSNSDGDSISTDLPVRLGSYRELTPHEFAKHHEMVVILVKIPNAVKVFQGFKDVRVLTECNSVDDLVADLSAGEVVGLVCYEGDCSSHTAIRLSRKGFNVHHLAGGLLEWSQAFPGGYAEAV